MTDDRTELPNAAVAVARSVVKAIEDWKGRGSPLLTNVGSSWAVVRSSEPNTPAVQLHRVMTQPEQQTTQVAMGFRAVQGTAAWFELIDVINHGGECFPFVGRMLLVGGMGLPVTGELIATMFVYNVSAQPEAIVAEGTTALTLSAWRESVAQVTDLRYRTTIAVQLVGLKGLSKPIGLSRDLEIAPMTDHEIIRGYEAGLIHPTFPGMAPLWISSDWAVRSRCLMQSNLVDPGTEGFGRRSEELAHNAQRLHGVVHALRIFKPGKVTITTAFAVLEPDDVPAALRWHWRGNGVQFFPLASANPSAFGIYELNDVEGEEFRRFYDRLSKAVTVSGELDNAVRRLSFAGERQREDDRLIDLMIAAEALLLENERAELAFKMSLRMALLVTLPPATRSQVLEFTSRAYDVRSKIVHGEQPKEGKLRGLDGRKLDLKGFTDECELVIRALVHHSVDVVADGRRLQDEWESALGRALSSG